MQVCYSSLLYSSWYKSLVFRGKQERYVSTAFVIISFVSQVKRTLSTCSFKFETNLCLYALLSTCYLRFIEIPGESICYASISNVLSILLLSLYAFCIS